MPLAFWWISQSCIQVAITPRRGGQSFELPLLGYYTSATYVLHLYIFVILMIIIFIYIMFYLYCMCISCVYIYTYYKWMMATAIYPRYHSTPVFHIQLVKDYESQRCLRLKGLHLDLDGGRQCQSFGCCWFGNAWTRQVRGACLICWLQSCKCFQLQMLKLAMTDKLHYC
jgi:hypothetical protein